MRVIIKEVGSGLKEVEIDNTLESLQDIVGGYIEVVTLGSGIVLVVNEEGKLQGLKRNFQLGNDTIVGTAVFISSVGEDFESLTDKQCEVIKKSLRGA